MPQSRSTRGLRVSKRVQVRCHLTSYFRAPSHRCSLPTIDRFAASFLRGSGGQVSGNKGPDASIARHVSATVRDGVAFLTGFVCLLISSNVIV